MRQPPPFLIDLMTLLVGIGLICLGCFVILRTDAYHEFNLRMVGRSWGRKHLEAWIANPISRVNTKICGGAALLMGALFVFVAGRTFQWW